MLSQITLAGIVAIGAAVGLSTHVLGVGATVGYLIHLLMVVLTVLTAAIFMKPENYTPQFKLFSWPDISLLVWVPVEFLCGVLLGIVFIGIWAVMIFALSTSY